MKFVDENHDSVSSLISQKVFHKVSLSSVMGKITL